MILVDTSAWIDFFRGREPVATAVDSEPVKKSPTEPGAAPVGQMQGATTSRSGATARRSNAAAGPPPQARRPRRFLHRLSALESGEAALCAPVLTELRRGLRTPLERRRVLPLLSGCHLLTEPTALWEDAGDIGFVLARRGATVKTLDLLIATYAIAHDVPILTTDRDFRRMRDSGIALALARVE